MIQKLITKIQEKVRKWRGPERLPDEMSYILFVALGHEENMPTRGEVGYFTPDQSSEEAEKNIRRLVEYGWLQKITATSPDGEGVIMYGLTEAAVEKAEMWDIDIQEAQSDFQDLSRTDGIRELENIPRPPTRRYYSLQVPEGDRL